MASRFDSISAKFDGFVAADRLERGIADELMNHAESVRRPFHLELDFSEIQGIDIVASQQLTANIIGFRKRNCWPIIRLPRKKAVRDFWRAWNYPDAFQQATGMSFSRLVHPEDYEFLDEPQTTYSIKDLRKILGHGLEETSRRHNFFGFFTEKLNSASPTFLADRETDRWSTDQIQDILSEHLGDSSDYVPSRVVFEAIFNAAKHPKASIVQSASFHPNLAGPRVNDANGIAKSEVKKSPFIMFFWDNGTSIVDTLGDAVKDGIDVRNGYSGGYDRTYNLKSKNIDGMGSVVERTLDSSEISFNSEHEDLLLISSLFPGVTSKPEGIYNDVHSVRDEIGAEDPNLTKRGMGLYVLMNAVVDVLSGELSIRTGRYFLHVKRLGPILSKQKQANVQLTVTKLPSSLPRFEGNLIRIKVN